TCARKHVGKKYVISLDIKDFFPSVTSDMVLRQLKREGFEDTGAWLIARLVAFKGVLPQGAITSPAASNVAFKPYDEKLQKYFEERGFVYTRYADDVTVSTDQEVTDEMIQQIVEETSQIIAPFKWNAKKIKIYGPNEPHYVLGLIVNAKPNVPKQKRRLIRAMVHNFVRKHALPQGEDPIRYKRKLMGKLAYCLFVNPHIESLLELYEELRKFDPNRVSEWKSLYVSEEEGE
ncbi:MAG: RNA-directed DNA polymerase, partial [Pseudothermotoga sp.]|nr:RNA-directed DNA polymerase [Pseudothermotoga sp.]